jgi:hypothetical protein
MRRREFIAGLGSATAWPLAARAQQADRIRRIVMPMVTAENDPQSRSWVAAFVEALEALGWKVGRNLQIDYRFDIFDDARAQSAIAELLKLSPTSYWPIPSWPREPRSRRPTPGFYVEPGASGRQHHGFLELGAERGH